MNARQRKQIAEKAKALRSFLATHEGEPNPETLSRSYGLSVPDVESIIREIKHG